MKTLFRFSIFAASILLFVPALQAEKPPTEEKLQRIRHRIDQITLDLHAIDLKIDRLTVETFLEIAVQKSTPISVSGMQLDWNDLFDTVPHLGKAHDDYRKASEELTVILMQDSEYNEIFNGPYPETSQDLYILVAPVYARLWENNADYKRARITRDKSLKERNIAIVRFLLEDCQAKGRLFPGDGLIEEDELDYIFSTPEIMDLLDDKYVLSTTQDKLKRDYTQLMAGIN